MRRIVAALMVFLEWLRESEARALRVARRGVALLAIAILAGPLLGGCNREETSHATNFGGDARRGADLIGKYGCGNRHDIPKIANADGKVAGFVRNSPDNMALWIRSPQRVLPGNVMPDMGVSEKEVEIWQCTT